MNDGTKNVLLVLKVNPEIATSQTFDAATKWLGEQCDRMSGNACKYHGVVLTDNDDYKLEVIEIDDEITKS